MALQQLTVRVAMQHTVRLLNQQATQLTTGLHVKTVTSQRLHGHSLMALQQLTVRVAMQRTVRLLNRQATQLTTGLPVRTVISQLPHGLLRIPLQHSRLTMKELTRAIVQHAIQGGLITTVEAVLSAILPEEKKFIRRL